VHCVASCFICLISYSVTDLAPFTCTFYCISYRLAIFPSMVVVRTYDSSSQGFNRAFNNGSLCCATSTYSFNTFSSCKFASLWVMVTMLVITLTLSYHYYSSRATVSSLCTLGSSYKLVTTSRESSRRVVQSFTMLFITQMTSLTTIACCSLTSGRVEGWAFNSNLQS